MSSASVWEAEIKSRLGRLDLKGRDLADEIALSGFVELPISARHAQQASRLERHHDDPFDRMLVGQARSEGLTLVSRDPLFALYEVPVLW